MRLTAEGGYQAQRSYSIASPPEERHITLTVERLELREPIGGYFSWRVADGGRCS